MVKRWTAIAMAVTLIGVCSSARAEELPAVIYSAKLGRDNWSISFDNKGKDTIKFKDGVVIEGTYRANKVEIDFKSETGQRADPANKIGKYKWKLDGKGISFTRVQD